MTNNDIQGFKKEYVNMFIEWGDRKSRKETEELLVGSQYYEGAGYTIEQSGNTNLCELGDIAIIRPDCVQSVHYADTGAAVSWATRSGEVTVLPLLCMSRRGVYCKIEETPATVTLIILREDVRARLQRVYSFEGQ